MAITDLLKGTSPVKIPGPVEARMKRGRERMKEGAPRRRMCLKFWRGDQYFYLSTQGQLLQQATNVNPGGVGKPPHRARTARNMIIDIVTREVSAVTQRVPNYEVDPSTADPDSIDAAKLAGKVARFGYDKWGIRRITEKVVTLAVVADEGFAWPYWDSSVGPYILDDQNPDQPKMIGQGEVAIQTFGPNQVYWEPGQDFDISRWHCVERTMTPQSVLELDGYLGTKAPEPDASQEDTGTSKAKLVMVTDYLERPTPTNDKGRWLTIAGGKQIIEERPYPCMDGKGNVLDEPVLHKLSYIADPDSDRDQGLVRHLLDAQRTFNNMNNKQQEWITHAIVPQIVVSGGEFKGRITDEPGAVYRFNGSGEVKFREIGQLPGELGEIKADALTDMQRIAAQNDIPRGVTASGAIQSLIESDQSRRYAFITSLAEWHSRLMRHCAAGETLVHTREGLRHARDLAGQTVDVLTQDGEYRPAKWESYGKRQLWLVEFEDGEMDLFTKGHQWVVQAKRRGDGFERVTTDQLEGRRVPLSNRRPHQPVKDAERYDEGVRNGLIYGDGHAATNTYEPTGSTYSFSRMKQYGEEMCEVTERFFRTAERKPSSHLGVAVATKCYEPELKAIPSSGEGSDYVLGFLAGALAADGHVNGSSMGLTSAKKDDLIAIRELARGVGLISTSITYTRRDTAYQKDSETWCLNFPASNFRNESVDEQLVLKPSHRAKMLRYAKRARTGFKEVVSVRPTQRVEEVFCCEEPVTHTWVAGNGYVTSNCLYLVQRHYTEARVLKIRGQWGPESINAFMGSQISDEVDVTVLPGDLAPRSRAQTEQRIMTYAQLGWVSPEQAMAAIDGGTSETLIDSYERHIERAYLIIQKVKSGTLFDVPMRPILPGEDAGPEIDPATGQPMLDQQGNEVMVQEVPGWMPRPFDNAEIQKSIFEDWMQSTDFDSLDDQHKQAAMAYYAALLDIEAKNADRAAQLQNQQAEQQGMQNAAQTQLPKPMPSLPALPSQNGGQGP